MRFKLAPGLALGPRKTKSTPTGRVSAGLPIPRPTGDGRVLAGFLSGVVLTLVALMAAAQIVHH
jgi:hypothetical protein